MTFKTFLLLKILDLAKGLKVQPKLSFYQRTKSWSRQQIKEHQENKLLSLFQYARGNTQYYSDILSKYNFSKGNCLSKITEIPILTRNDIQQNNNYLLSSQFRKEQLIRGSSSGTTGTPLIYYSDKHGTSAGIAAGYALWAMSGWNLGQRNVHLWGNQSSVERWEKKSSKAKNRLINQKNIPATALNNPANFEAIANDIIRFRPKSIEGYSSSIYTLGNFFKDKGFELDSLKQVFTTAENLEDSQKELIEEVFAPAGDLYGSGEILGVASRPAGKSKFYVMDPHIIIETIDSGVPGMKDVLLTDLDNYGMPFIRYKIGDMIDDIHEPDPNDKYPYSWFTKIHGRSSDIITLPNGKKFHPVNIFGGTLFRKFPEITRHKVIWNGETLRFIFETTGFHKQDELTVLLRDLIKEYQVDFTMEFTEKILPSKSGKHKYMEIVNKGTQK
ncbi:MAG: hypothetical protein ACOCWC_03730 [Bacteroidota bacterium]